MEALPPEIDDADPLGRRIRSSKQVQAARNNNCRHHVFLDAGYPSLSVDRLDLVPDSTIAAIADSEPGNTFYGWAVVTAGVAREDDRTVRANPTATNPYHAEIGLPEKALADEEERKQHAQDLAAAATWRPRPA